MVMMMKTFSGKRIAAVLAVMGLGISFVAGSATAQTSIKIGHDSATGHPYQVIFEEFKKVLEAETNGAVEVLIYPDAQLGNETQMLEGIRLGTLDGAMATGFNVSTFVPEMELFNLPFLFKDVQHVYRVADGPIGDGLEAAIETQLKARVLGWTTTGARVIWNNRKPIVEPEDLEGIKMRVPNTPIMVDTFNAFGAVATTIPFSELYTALQQGVVDGADNDVVDIVAMKFNEVTKYVSMSNHLIVATVFVFSKSRFDSFSPEIQSAVVKAAEAGISAGRVAQENLAASAVDELKAKGLVFNDVDLDAFVKLVDPIYAKYADSVGGMELIEKVKSQ
jgi:tripartite ATP-independent transporter DctP family solute receptor